MIKDRVFEGELITENQLANKLAKKIKDAFNRVDIRIANARAPSDFNLVKIAFAPA